MFDTFMSDLSEGTERPLRQFADDTELGEAAETPEDAAAIQRDLDRLERWAQ